ncbi:hypothetical protein CTZ27_03005 [Streptomyces griseocarneus]|nr:hypothetical protein CTZ27_03005 [Streptomyces griseocarneus]
MIDTTKIYRPDQASDGHKRIQVIYGTEPDSLTSVTFWDLHGDVAEVDLGPLELAALINMLISAQKTTV